MWGDHGELMSGASERPVAVAVMKLQHAARLSLLMRSVSCAKQLEVGFVGTPDALCATVSLLSSYLL